MSGGVAVCSLGYLLACGAPANLCRAGARVGKYVGLYVGFATVGVFGYWYTAYDWSEYGHPLISVSHLSNWGKCSHFGEMAEFTSDPCAPRLPPADAPRARRRLTAAAV